MRKTGFQKATERIEKEGKKQCQILYGCAGLALSRHWGKGQKAILNLFDESLKAWNECAKTTEHSMVSMCEQETGIEIQNGDGVSWHDVAYMNNSIPVDEMSYEQWLYMRQQQIKWIAPQIMACLMVAMHRKWGFGFERCSRIYSQIEDIKYELRCDPKRIRKTCRDETGIDVLSVVTA